MVAVTKLVFHDAATVSSAGNELQVDAYLTKFFEVTTTSFSGTLDIQVSFDGSNWTNTPYVLLGQDGPAASNTETLQYTQDTGRRSYVVLEPSIWMRVNMVRTAGSVSVKGRGHENSVNLPIAVA
jgi:hypothetical protein